MKTFSDYTGKILIFNWGIIARRWVMFAEFLKGFSQSTKAKNVAYA